MARSQVARQPDRPGDVDAARAAETESFLLDEVEEDRQRLGVGDLVGVVDGDALEVACDAALADALRDRGALGLELTVLEVVVHRRAHRVGDGDHDLATLLFERGAHSGERAAGADRADERVDVAVGLAPDLRPGRSVVGVAVRKVVPLVRVEDAVRLALRALGREPLGDVDVVVRVAIRNRRHLAQLGAA